MRTHLLRSLDRMTRTGLQTLVGYLTAAGTVGGVHWRTAGLAVCLTIVVSGLQSMVDLPPLPGGWAGNITARALRTFAQTTLGSTIAATLITDLDWPTVLSVSALAAITSIATSLITTPIGPPGTPELFAPPPAAHATP